MQAALESAARGRSVLVVAHRLSTVRAADIIVVMRSGVVVEMGSHADLLAARGAYHSLVLLQLADAPGSLPSNRGSWPALAQAEPLEVGHEDEGAKGAEIEKQL